VYLDHAATTPLSPAARDAMLPYLDAWFGNASEPHAYGREARAGLERARLRLAELLGAGPGQIVFTSGGTEADNLALFGLAGEPPGRLVVSAVEHAAVHEAALLLEHRGFEVAWAPVTGDGIVDVAAFAALVQPGDRLAAVMWANNVTGVVQPLAELAAIAAERGVPLHTDAVQAAAGLPVDVGAVGAATAAFSAHKLNGPKGVGCLVVRDPAALQAQQVGGGQERGLRSGTENVAGVVGFAAALDDRRGRADERRSRRDLLERLVAGVAAPIAAPAPRLDGHSLLLVDGVRAELLVLALDQAGYAVSAGSACTAGESEPSHVLLAQGLTPDRARSVIRVSLGLDTTAGEVEGFAGALRSVVDRLSAGALLPAPAGN
jgi:cysteine desulfurase